MRGRSATEPACEMLQLCCDTKLPQPHWVVRLMPISRWITMQTSCPRHLHTGPSEFAMFPVLSQKRNRIFNGLDSTWTNHYAFRLHLMLTSQNPNPTAQKPFILWRPLVWIWQWLVPPTLADRDRQSPMARVIAATVIVTACVGLVVLVFTNAHTWGHVVRTWQSNRAVADSERLEKGERTYEAVLAANKAYRLDPSNPNAVRNVARYATMLRRQEALYLWGQLDKLGELTDDDVVWSITALANLQQDKAAEDAIDELLKKRPPSEKLVAVADSVLQRLHRTSQLIELLENYAKQKPDDKLIQVALGTRLVQFGTPDQVKEGKDLLWKAAEDDGDAGLKSLEFLYKVKADSDEEQDKLIDRLQHHPKITEEHRIAALRRLVDRHPDRKAAVIDNAIAYHVNSSREDLPPLLTWLNDEQEYDRVITLLKPREEIVKQYQPLLTPYLNALTLTKRYDELSRIINDPETRLLPAERSMHRMHLAYVMHPDDKETLKLRIADALQFISDEANNRNLLLIGRYAEDRGLLDDALKAYKAASVQRMLERDGFEGVLRITHRLGDTKTYMSITSEMCRRWPDNNTYAERHIYACLLCGEDMETAFHQAQKLLEARPSDSQRKLLVALGFYRMKQPEDSIRTMQNTNLPELNAGQGAVFCGIMCASNQRLVDQAKSVASTIPTNGEMLPEERRFLTLVK